MSGTALTLVKSQETRAQKIARLQSEMKAESRDEVLEILSHVGELVAAIESLTLVAKDGAVAPGIVDLLSRLAEQAAKTKATAESILSRS